MKTPIFSRLSLNTIYNIKHDQELRQRDWNDNCLIVYTREKDNVQIDNHYRYARSKSKIMSLTEFKKWFKTANSKYLRK